MWQLPEAWDGKTDNSNNCHEKKQRTEMACCLLKMQDAWGQGHCLTWQTGARLFPLGALIGLPRACCCTGDGCLWESTRMSRRATGSQPFLRLKIGLPWFWLLIPVWPAKAPGSWHWVAMVTAAEHWRMGMKTGNFGKEGAAGGRCAGSRRPEEFRFVRIGRIRSLIGVL